MPRLNGWDVSSNHAFCSTPASRQFFVFRWIESYAEVMAKRLGRPL